MAVGKSVGRGLLALSSCSLSYRGASFDCSTPAKMRWRPRSSPCGYPAMSITVAWLITCSLISAGGLCCSTWLWVRAGLIPRYFPSFLLLGSPQTKRNQKETFQFVLFKPFVLGQPIARGVERVGKQLYIHVSITLVGNFD